MRDVDQHATHSAAAKDQDPEHPPEPGRRRGDPGDPGGDNINPTPPQRGGDELSQPRPEGRRRGDPGDPGGGNINPTPPQRGG
jgi:hypothetical protein